MEDWTARGSSSARRVCARRTSPRERRWSKPPLPLLRRSKKAPSGVFLYNERMEKFPTQSEENEIEGAAQNAGLYDVELPRVGTKAYDSLMETARKYLETIKMLDRLRAR